MYELVLKIKDKEDLHNLWENSEGVWKKTNVSVKANNRKTAWWINDNVAVLTNDEIEAFKVKNGE